MADATFAMIVPLGGHSPVDPGFGGGIANRPNMPGIDNSLPPAPPNTPPGVIWPPLNPPHPDHSLPRPPSGNRPDNTLPGSQPGVDNTLPGQPVRPDNTLPGSGKYWVVVGIPGYGWRWTCIDPSLTIDNTLPSGGGQVDNTLPQTPAPKR